MRQTFCQLLFRFRSGPGPLAVFLFIFTLFVNSAAGQTTQSPVPLPVPFTPVVDNAQVIDAQTRERLESIWRNLQERAGIQFAVLTVPTTGDLDIFDFSLAVARGWGIGAKDGDQAGLLLVVAIQDRKYFTQVSRHLEGDLPDGVVGRIQRERLVPAFRQGNYSKGILDTIQACVATLAAKRGFSVEGIDQSYADIEERTRSRERQSGRPSSFNICCVIILIAIVLILLFSASRRRGGGGGCLEALFWGSLFSNLSSGRSSGHSSGWGGGGFGGGGFGGGGGGFGGGFGGGGDFGGGGAGGSW